jgi:hypothetical protein
MELSDWMRSRRGGDDGVRTPEQAPDGEHVAGAFDVSNVWKWPVPKMREGCGSLLSATFFAAFLCVGRGLAFAAVQSGWYWMLHKIYEAIFG